MSSICSVAGLYAAAVRLDCQTWRRRTRLPQRSAPLTTASASKASETATSHGAGCPTINPCEHHERAERCDTGKCTTKPSLFPCGSQPSHRYTRCTSQNGLYPNSRLSLLLPARLLGDTINYRARRVPKGVPRVVYLACEKCDDPRQRNHRLTQHAESRECHAPNTYTFLRGAHRRVAGNGSHSGIGPRAMVRGEPKPVHTELVASR